MTRTGLVCTLTGIIGGQAGVQLCDIANPNNAIDANDTTHADVQITAGLLGLVPTAGDTLSLTVKLLATIPAGQAAGFIVSTPSSVVDLSVAKAVTVSTSVNGVATADSFMSGGLGAPMLVGSSGEMLVAIPKTTAPYNWLTITVVPSVANVNLNSSLFIHEACLAVTPAP